jgi:transketolase
MRATLIETLGRLAAADPRIVLLTGDLGYAVVEPFQQRFPTRFFNLGVAEQNMIGMATGLASKGFLPYVYSIAPFNVFRPYEFIRNGPVLHNLPVRLLGIGGGFDYGHNGISHYGLEDVGALRLQPGVSIVCPADAAQARTAIEATAALTGPIYYRLGRDEDHRIEELAGRFTLGRPELLRTGSELLFVGLGPIVVQAMHAARLLKTDGLDAAVLLVATVAPPPGDDFIELLARYRLVVTVEEHYSTGGLGSLVAELAADNGLGCRLIRCGVSGPVDGRTGSAPFMRQLYGLTGEAIASRVRDDLRKTSGAAGR